MKSTKLLFLGILGFTAFFGNAQATTVSTTNTVTSTAYLGSGATSDFDVVFKRKNIPAGKLAATFTNFGLNSLATPNSVSLGVSAGQFSSGTGGNTFIGHNAGKGQSTSLNSGNSNTFIGYNSGYINTTGYNNTFIGKASGNNNTNGRDNIFVGTEAGLNNNTGIGNIAIGTGAGARSEAGNNNIFLGSYSGCEDNSLFSNSIFIGNQSGYTQCSSNTLVIDQGENDNPLIWGDFANDRLKFHGKVGIGGNTATAFGNFPNNSGGVSVSNYNLFVKGGILTDEVRVSTTWADYVFAKEYKLPTLQEVEKHIQEKGHLINVPSAKQVEEDGLELGEMAKIQQEKIEELTLYIIEQNKTNEAQNKLIMQLCDRLNAIERR